LKQLEGICSKQKGIVSQSVKDVLQNLVDDSIVKTDKIGTGVYFWCFPSDDANVRKTKLEKLNNEVKTLKVNLETTQSNLEKRKGRSRRNRGKED